MGPFPAKANIWKLVLQDNPYLNAKNVMLIPLILERTHVIYLCTRVRVEYPTIYINIEAIQHILIVTHIYAFEKNIHSYAQGIASKFTPNLYPKHLLLQTTYIYLKYISYKFLLFHSHLFILASYLHYAHTCIQKGIPCYHTFI